MGNKYFSANEQIELKMLYRSVLKLVHGVVSSEDIEKIRRIIVDGVGQSHNQRDRYGINPTLHTLQTAVLMCEKISPDRNIIISIMLYNLCKS